ncbi:non-specific lipid-transfer protein 1 [Actinidia eriantha]|uniref:non-specific lipid-transfer protein 1 n=1 Tax=Actinidia eriantha TaxID=165200 RepID=UPI0025863B4D|nr:non-specific lipid-transfer protein 1 [Actinidia eriantha]
MIKGLAITVVAVLAVVQLLARPTDAAVSCGQVDTALTPCLTYLTKGGTPSTQCCSGVRSLKSMTGTKADRQTACNCLKQAAARYQAIKDAAAAALSQKCGVQFSVPISRKTDCSKIS